jgi:hypothetical protein
MPEDDYQPEHIWDEYDWERFLQQQERRTEKYMELIEKYVDHPDRDSIIAREMGWTHLLGEEAKEWEEEVDAEFEAIVADDGNGEVECDDSIFGFEKNPLYQSALAFTAELHETFDKTPNAVQEHPATIELNSQATLAAAKLAAALNNDEIDEIGMSIAYLKRALRAISMGLEAAFQLGNSNLLEEEDFKYVRDRLFQIRDGIVVTMGEMRSEFRRRYGHS